MRDVTGGTTPAWRSSSTPGPRSTSSTASITTPGPPTTCRPPTASGCTKSAPSFRNRCGTCPQHAGAIFAATFLVDHPAITEAEHLVEHVRSLPGAALAKAVLADDLRRADCQPLMHSALDGTEDAIVEVVASWPTEKRAFLERLLREPDQAIRDLSYAAHRVAPELQGDRGPHRRHPQARRGAAPEGPRAAGSARADRGDHERHPLADRAGRPAVILAPSYFTRPFNFVVRAPRTGGCSATRSPMQPSMRTTHSHPRPPSFGSIGHWATRAGCGSFGCSATATGTCPRSRSACRCPSPRSSTTSRSSGPPGSSRSIEEGGLSYYSLRRDRLDDASGDLKRYLI